LAEVIPEANPEFARVLTRLEGIAAKRRLRALTLRLLTPKQPLLCVAGQRHELLIRVSIEALEVTR